MKRVVLIGGSGTIGSILLAGLKHDFELYNLDLANNPGDNYHLKTDAQNYSELLNHMPKDADVVINLLSIPFSGEVVDIPTMNKMVDVFLKSSYNIFQAAVELNIPKVIIASSNHVTDYYESEGNSKLGRRISVKDYPYSRGLYGVLKLAVENIGFTFSNKYNLSVINLRIGSVKLDEETTIYKDIDRHKKTWLSEVDTVSLFRDSILSDIKFGTFYGVSDNPEKPWSNKDAKEELGFVSKVNAEDIINETKKNNKK